MAPSKRGCRKGRSAHKSNSRENRQEKASCIGGGKRPSQVNDVRQNTGKERLEEQPQSRNNKVGPLGAVVMGSMREGGRGTDRADGDWREAEGMQVSCELLCNEHYTNNKPRQSVDLFRSTLY